MVIGPYVVLALVYRFAVKQGLEQVPQVLFGPVAASKFGDAQFDLASHLPQGRVRLGGESPGFVVEPISELVERACVV